MKVPFGFRSLLGRLAIFPDVLLSTCGHMFWCRSVLDAAFPGVWASAVFSWLVTRTFVTLSGAVQFKTLSLEVLVLVGPLRPATLDMYDMFWCRWFQTQPLQVPSAIAAFPDVLLSTCVRHFSGAVRL